MTAKHADRRFCARSAAAAVKRAVDTGRRRGQAIARRLRLPADAERDAIAAAAALGIGADARIVTVHVREAGYRSAAGLRQRQWDTLRNARIATSSAGRARRSPL